jgi:hypothetical protein
LKAFKGVRGEEGVTEGKVKEESGAGLMSLYGQLEGGGEAEGRRDLADECAVVWSRGGKLEVGDDLTRGAGRSVKERREGGEVGHRGCLGQKKERADEIKLGRGENLGRQKRKRRGELGGLLD